MKIAGPHLPFNEGQEHDTGHGKLSAHLDLREEPDVGTLRELVAEADVLSQGYRPGTLAQRGLSPEDLAKIRPGIIYVSLCAFGRVGPWATAAASTPWCRPSAASPTARVNSSPAPRLAPSSTRCPPSTTLPATSWPTAPSPLWPAAPPRAAAGWCASPWPRPAVGWWAKARFPESDLRDVPNDFTPEEIAAWSTTSQAPDGALQHLSPVLELSETQPTGQGPPFPGLPRPGLARPLQLVAWR